jgi:hypothetical protein
MGVRAAARRKAKSQAQSAAEILYMASAYFPIP